MNTDKSRNTSRRFKFTLSCGQLRKFHYKLWNLFSPNDRRVFFIFLFKIYLRAWYGSGKWFCDSISVLSLLPFRCSVVTVSHIFLRIINENSFKERLSFLFVFLSTSGSRFILNLLIIYHCRNQANPTSLWDLFTSAVHHLYSSCTNRCGCILMQSCIKFILWIVKCSWCTKGPLKR